MTCNHIQVLDHAKAGQWHEAHEIVQQYSDQWSCLIHGYLHRVEGDISNARYWYNRAETKIPANSLEQELERLYLLVSKSG